MRYWLEFALNNAAAWFATYLVFSTVGLGTIVLVSRTNRLAPATENAVWRWMLWLVPVLVTARIAMEHVGTRPVGTGPAALTIRGTGGWILMVAVPLAFAAGSFLVIRLARAARLERIGLHREPVTDGWLADEVERLAVAAGRPVPRLTRSPAVNAPIAIGSAEICLPASGLDTMPRAAVRAVLAHELAHLGRNDPLWVWMVHFVERLFFLQPLYRLASRRVHETAEFVADEFAVRATGSPEHLIDALTAFARSSPGLALTGFAPGSLLVRRVQRVLERPPGQGPQILPIVLIVCALALAVWFSPAVVPDCDCRFAGLLF